MAPNSVRRYKGLFPRAPVSSTLLTSKQHQIQWSEVAVGWSRLRSSRGRPRTRDLSDIYSPHRDPPSHCRTEDGPVGYWTHWRVDNLRNLGKPTNGRSDAEKINGYHRSEPANNCDETRSNRMIFRSIHAVMPPNEPKLSHSRRPARWSARRASESPRRWNGPAGRLLAQLNVSRRGLIGSSRVTSEQHQQTQYLQNADEERDTREWL